MTLSQEDHFILSKTISGTQERINEWNEPDFEGRGQIGYTVIHKASEEILGMLAGLRDVVNELAGLETSNQSRTE